MYIHNIPQFGMSVGATIIARMMEIIELVQWGYKATNITFGILAKLLILHWIFSHFGYV